MTPAALAPILRAGPDVIRAVGEAIDAGERDPAVAQAAIERRRQRDRDRAEDEARDDARRDERLRQKRIDRAVKRLADAIRNAPEAVGVYRARVVSLLTPDERAAVRAHLPTPEP